MANKTTSEASNSTVKSEGCSSASEHALPNAFFNLDDPANLNHLIKSVQNSLSRNFVVGFDENTACAAFDLSATSILRLLETERPEPLSTYWINIWYPYYHRPLLEWLAKRCDFSPRLLALMSSDPKRRQSSPIDHQHNPHGRRSRHAWRRRTQPVDREYNVETPLDELSEHSSISSDNSIARGNLYRIVDDLWHYSSVDFGRDYTCIGYNSLYGTKHPGSEAGNGALPHCTRVWSWLVLCADNTVISINEDPFPFAEGRLDATQQRILTETRRNLVTVFRSLCKVDEAALMATKPMIVLPIRTRLGESSADNAATSADAPGLLFYYLFENWHNSYTLVTRKESRYTLELTSLRADMFRAPQLAHIDRLDNIGKELGVLKRHYQSYDRLIDRLLENSASPTTTAVLQSSQVVHSAASQTSLDTIRPVVMTERETLPLDRVMIPEAARTRFTRLKDLIDLYALSEISAYLLQKDSLTTLNFNLIAIKESLDVERLTRATLLLTKLSILFLPVSLLTTYFSVQTVGVQYTLREYWVSFAVTLGVSWLALFWLGVWSGSVQTLGWIRGFWEGVEGTWGWMVGRGL